jgi:Mg-chelatase subunit ChlD
VPIGALDTAVSGTPRRLLVERTLKSLRARGATGLYDSTWAAYRRMERGFEPTMNNTIVLLTDGRNEAVGGLSLAELVKRLKAADPKKPIQIVTIAFGADADHRALAQISAATGGASYRANSAADIQKIYVSSLARYAGAALR